MHAARAFLLVAAALLALHALPVPRAAQPGGAPAPEPIVVTPTPDGAAYQAVAPGYTAWVDARHGNLRLANARGDLLLGGGAIDGLVVATGNALHQPGGMEAGVLAADNAVTVLGRGFALAYTFGADGVQVVLEATEPTDPLLAPLRLLAASVPEPSREAAMRFSLEAYRELGAYPTDYWTDSSSGQFGLWTTAVYSVGGHTYRPAMLRPTMEGLCRWETPRGRLVVDHAGGHDVNGSPLYRETCGLSNATDLEAAGTVLLRATHQVLQEVGGLSPGSRASLALRVDGHGYDVHEVLYPVSTRVTSGANTGLTSAKLVVPHAPPPPAGYPLVLYMPGHWDELYTHSYLWDFLANHGYVVAVPFTTADMGDGHQRDDWGYMSQVESEELRQWVMATRPIDPDRVYTAGLSLGGLNALLNAINHPDAYAATLYYSGVYDFVRFWATPLGASSFALNVEAALCCGDPVTHPYEYAIRNPRERIAQFQGGLFAVQGDADPVAPADHALELSLAVPGSVLHLAQGAHENNVFAGFRKEALAFLQAQPPRPAEQRDRADLLVYGHPALTPAGFQPFEGRRSHSTEWMTVWVEDEAFTRVQAERLPTGIRVQADRPMTVAAERPPWCVPDCTYECDPDCAFLAEGPAPAWDANRTAVLFDLPAGTPATLRFTAVPAPPPPQEPAKDTPHPAAALLALALAAAAVAVRRRA